MILLETLLRYFRLSSPAGQVAIFAGASAPSGWLFCYGQTVSRTTYSELFTAIGTTYGAGDGSTTFGIPDLRGRVVAGQDDMGGSSANRLTGLAGGVDGDVLGGVGGEESHVLSVAELANHSHVEQVYSTNTAGTRRASGNGSGTLNSSTSNGTTGSDSPHNNIQPTIVLNYIIKI